MSIFNALSNAKQARKLNGEVISADSVQLYKHVNIGANKVSAEVRSMSGGCTPAFVYIYILHFTYVSWVG